ncbi:MAG: hypothetical protein A2X61_17065 [Ignavibacteria bacterium GWB2_35_12]|nr:MAG: hypothetical protein A2X63_06550 [Ignavibacteria bacterium GWA2_35_8]OGU38072.1 MAG: hypothetical protein A2X61_17065 [Ignavibacteria bacterium GWB2_35_12]OGU95187.1 MAG: hypothetical protein A2220_03285 [Ignavibacteria bacterium RIFOXYA2_FULL_35_10]OGV25095.1 MAG: hypothetical protein A2475_16560 [Ignavibacteria bacterium RIFOXYC2_FULL_35_21]
MIFIVEKDTLKDSFLIENIQIYKDLKSIKISEDETPNQISYLKEQAWKTDFKVELVQKILFTSIIKTSGQILSAPGDEIIITATASGQVRFVKNNLLQGISVAKGARLFEIETSDLTDGNLETKYNEAKANNEKAKADLQRADLLVKDKIISDKDYLVTKNAYKQSEINLKTYSKNTRNGKKNIYSQLDGFIKKIYIHNGDYVSTGQQLASISKNKTLILQADLSSQFYSKLNKVIGANFKTIGNDNTYDIKDFNGKIVSYAKSSDALTFYTPIYFELTNNGELVTGSFAEIFLKTKEETQQVVIPMTALTEESGKFFVYVQIGGESFLKKEVELGDNDGINIVVLQGLSEGERVVTRGAIQVKMAAASTAIPHGHEH